MGDPVGGEWGGGARLEDGGREGAVAELCDVAPFLLDSKYFWLKGSSDLHCNGSVLILE